MIQALLTLSLLCLLLVACVGFGFGVWVLARPLSDTERAYMERLAASYEDEMEVD